MLLIFLLRCRPSIAANVIGLGEWRFQSTSLQTLTKYNNYLWTSKSIISPSHFPNPGYGPVATHHTRKPLPINQCSSLKHSFLGQYVKKTPVPTIFVINTTKPKAFFLLKQPILLPVSNREVLFKPKLGNTCCMVVTYARHTQFVTSSLSRMHVTYTHHTHHTQPCRKKNAWKFHLFTAQKMSLISL